MNPIELNSQLPFAPVDQLAQNAAYLANALSAAGYSDDEALSYAVNYTAQVYYNYYVDYTTNSGVTGSGVVYAIYWRIQHRGLWPGSAVFGDAEICIRDNFEYLGGGANQHLRGVCGAAVLK